SGTSLFVRLNLGPSIGFSTTPYIVTAPPCSLPFLQSCLRVTQSAVGTDFNRVIWVETRDINGDGIPDYLSTDPSTPARTVRFGQFTYAGGCVPQQECSEGPKFGPPVALDLGTSFVGLGTGQQSGGNYLANRDLVDVNGDGLPDVVTRGVSSPFS